MEADGCCHLHDGRYAEAVASFRQALALGASWMAQLVEWLTLGFGLGHDPRVSCLVEGLHLPLLPLCLLGLFLCQINNKILKKKENLKT